MFNLHAFDKSYIMFDEFISKVHINDEFGEFVQLLSTIIRDKTDVKILMLANSQDIYNEYLQTLDYQCVHYNEAYLS